MIPPELAVALVAISLLAGIGITAIGPGGIFVTIALFALAPLSSAEVAGTASATFVATGLLGSLVYGRSGELSHGTARELAILLGLSSVGGAIVGTQLNLRTSDRLFGYLLGAFVFLVGAVILYRERVGVTPVHALPTMSPGRRRGIVTAIGVGIGIVGGMLGVGGPVIAVPVLVALGVPMLAALAVSQVQSIFVSGFATLGYALSGAISVPFALLVGVPQLIGVVVGWRIAHRIEPGRLRVALGVALLVVAPILVR